MAGQGSGGNVVAALCSLLIPGLGQLLQGRFFTAVATFWLAFFMWFLMMGWLIHLLACLDAAKFVPKHLRPPEPESGKKKKSAGQLVGNMAFGSK